MDKVILNGKVISQKKATIPLDSDWAKFASGFF